MKISFEKKEFERLWRDPKFNCGFDAAIVKAYRKHLQFITAAEDERAFYSMKSLHYEKLVGDRIGQSSMRLNQQWRLILRIEKNMEGKLVVIISIEDYH